LASARDRESTTVRQRVEPFTGSPAQLVFQQRRVDFGRPDPVNFGLGVDDSRVFLINGMSLIRPALGLIQGAARMVKFEQRPLLVEKRLVWGDCNCSFI